MIEADTHKHTHKELDGEWVCMWMFYVILYCIIWSAQQTQSECYVKLYRPCINNGKLQFSKEYIVVFIV